MNADLKREHSSPQAANTMAATPCNIEPLTPVAIARKAEQYAILKTGRSVGCAFSLAISAGAFIALAFIFYVSVTTGNGDMGWGIQRLIGGLCFSMGIMLVIVLGGELFTSTVLSAVPRASGMISTAQMLKNWTIVYAGNLVGALAMVALMMLAKQYMLANSQWGVTALNIASHKLEHSFSQAVVLGILCNILVCLAIWMAYAARTMMEKAFIVMLPVAMFVAAGFEHCVANMFMIPLGIAIQHFAPAEFWQAAGVSADHYAHLNIPNFISLNLIPVTIGNIIGGAGIVGLGYWRLAIPEGTASPAPTPTTASQPPLKPQHSTR
ncbi:putative formate transporter 1 [Sinobacterium norvegicum]|uniref:Formate transporter FocA n=1 Tax=Sinobacterium norvegicum TaxID=1641715 RepID=A0ABM9AA20_9GAMM|nr:formate transporter FocA [Sinobacterium norvegicum]CAH0989946.1 putative formate transporter 1 [Sinobacterium norvegicum]